MHKQTKCNDGVEVVAFCLLGLIASSAVRLLAWSDCFDLLPAF